jgi:hypothetical protein
MTRLHSEVTPDPLTALVVYDSDPGSAEADEHLSKHLGSISRVLMRSKDCITRWTQDPKSKLKVRPPAYCVMIAMVIAADDMSQATANTTNTTFACSITSMFCIDIIIQAHNCSPLAGP